MDIGTVLSIAATALGAVVALFVYVMSSNKARDAATAAKLAEQGEKIAALDAGLQSHRQHDATSHERLEGRIEGLERKLDEFRSHVDQKFDALNAAVGRLAGMAEATAKHPK